MIRVQCFQKFSYLPYLFGSRGRRNWSSSTPGKLTILKVDEKTNVATLALNRPPVNSLNLELLQEIHQSIEEVENAKCRGLILTSVNAYRSRIVNCRPWHSFKYLSILEYGRCVFGWIRYYGNVPTWTGATSTVLDHPTRYLVGSVRQQCSNGSLNQCMFCKVKASLNFLIHIVIYRVIHQPAVAYWPAVVNIV